jgi:hypothetical protein
MSFWNEHKEEEPEFSEYLENQEVYNFKTIQTNCASIHLFGDNSIIVHEEDFEPACHETLNKYLIEVLGSAYNGIENNIDNDSDLERIAFVQEVLADAQ